MKFGLFEIGTALLIWLLLGSASHVTAQRPPPLPSPVAVTATPGEVVRVPTPEPIYFVWLPVIR